MNLSSSNDNFKINNLLNSNKHNSYRLSSTEIDKKNHIYLAKFYLDELIFAGEYIVLGSFDNKKGVWMWSTISPTLNLSMKNDVHMFRNLIKKYISNHMNNHKLLFEFITSDFSPHSLTEFINILDNLSNIMIAEFQRFGQCIISVNNKLSYNTFDILLFNKIIINKL
jgi:hypothetical protein